MSRVQANLLLLLAGGMWGMGFVAQSTAMAAIGPLLFVGTRFLLAALTALPLAILEARRSPDRLAFSDWRAFGLIGLMLFCAIVPQQFGLLTTSVTNSGFLTGLYVVITPILVVLIFRHFPHRVVWLGAILALAGIFLLSGGELGRLTAGDWLTILGAVFCALQMIFIARHARRTGRPVTLAATQFAACSALGLAGALAFETISLDGLRNALPEIFYAGIFSGGIAFTLQVIAQRYTSASQAAIFLSSEAVFATMFGAIFLGERIAPIGLAGCGLILAAMLLVEIVPALRPARRVTP